MTEILLATINDIQQSAAGVSSFNSRTGAVALTAADIGAASQIAAVSHQFLTSLGPNGVFTLAQPSFTDIAGIIASAQLPIASAAALGAVKVDGTTITIASGVISAVGGSTGVSSFNTRTGAVTLTAADVGAVSQIAATSHQFLTSLGANGLFTLAQPSFADIAGTIAAAQLPNPSATTLGGVKSLAVVAHQFLTGIDATGTPSQAQPAFSDLSGSVAAAQMPALTGDVTTVAGAVATTIAANAVTNAKAAQMAANTIKGNNTGLTANAGDLTSSQVTTMLALPGAFEFIIDGGGAVIATGLWKGYFEVPYACTITQSTLLADESGSISIDVLKTTYANFDAGATHPVAADKISAAAPLTIATATKAQDTVLTGWTKTLSAGDIIGFNIISVTSIQRVTVSLRVTRS